MLSSRLLTSVTVMLVAMLLVASSFAVIYYGEAQQRGSESKNYQDELSSALSHYNQFAGSYVNSLKGYNSALSLLSQALSNLNTTSSAYINGSKALANLWMRYLSLERSAGVAHASYAVNMRIDFGNGTARWYNDSAIKPGWNAYLATVVIFNGTVKASWYPQFQEHFVTGIGGAESVGTNSWFFWVHNGTEWQLAPTGADAVQAYNGSTFAWGLCGYDANFNPTCTP